MSVLECPPASVGDDIEPVLAQLDRELVALAPVKNRLREIAALLVVDELRRQAGLTAARPTLHMCFTGNPGTGKTTVALRTAEILYRLGYIKRNHVVAVTRDDLVGQYVGHTAPKTKEVIKRAYGGVLFIDEAYYLYRPENERDYGVEAIEILLQVMENERERLVVILAGYRDRMEEFFSLNPGMASRVAHHIDFPDYGTEELMAIGRLMLDAASYELSPRRRGGAARGARPRGGPAPVRARPQRAQRGGARPAAPRQPDLRRRPRRDRGHPGRAHADRGAGHRVMPRPVILGVVGDSASGKTTISRGLVRVLGEDNVAHICTDDYHRYDRAQRAELQITPLHPDCNHLDIIAQHLAHLRRGEPILKPVYRHQDGTFGPAVHVRPERFTIIEGLLGYHRPAMRDVYDVRVFLAPPEPLRRRWKVQRDCSRRGYTTDQVLAELDRREPDSEAFIRPQRHHADLLVSFLPPADDDDDQVHLDAELTLRDGLPHPDLAPFIDGRPDGLTLTERDGERVLRIPGRIEPTQAAAIEEAIWARMHFATHLRARRLGEFTVATDLRRSEALALVQLLILFHLVTARATVALGGERARADPVAVG